MRMSLIIILIYEVIVCRISEETLPTPVTASFGIACANVNDNLDSLLKRADQALYRAKESGRNSQC